MYLAIRTLSFLRKYIDSITPDLWFSGNPGNIQWSYEALIVQLGKEKQEEP
jgi:hypothetical protein